MERQRQRELKKAKEDRRHKAFMDMVEEAKKERAQKKAEEEEEAEEKRIKEAEAHVAAQEKTANTGSTRSRRAARTTGRRVKCVIKEKDEQTPVPGTRIIKEVAVSGASAAPSNPVWPAAEQGDSAVGEVVKEHRSQQRKDRQARLRKAMAAVEAEKKSKDSNQEQYGTEAKTEDEVVKAETCTRFAQLSAKEIEQQLENDMHVDEDAELIQNADGLTHNAAPTIYGTSKYDELWAKASEILPELHDDAAAGVDVLDVEELD